MLKRERERERESKNRKKRRQCMLKLKRESRSAVEINKKQIRQRDGKETLIKSNQKQNLNGMERESPNSK